MGFKQFFNKAYSALSAAGRATKAELRPIFRDFYDSGITDVEKAVAKYNETKVAINAAVDAASNGTERVVSIKPIGKRVVNSGERAVEQTTESAVERTTLKPPGAPDPNARNIGKEILSDSRQEAYWKDQEERIRKIKEEVANRPAPASASPTQATTEEAPWITGSNKEKYQNFIEGLEKDAEFDAKYGTQLDRLRLGQDINTGEPIAGYDINIGKKGGTGKPLKDSDFPAVTATGEQLGLVKPKQSEFTIQGSFGPTPPKPDFIIKSSENVLGSNAAAYDKPVTPILKSNGKVDYTKFKLTSPGSEEETAWGSTAKAALGTAVTGAALCAALSSSRGQQNNAQLYGQQPLY